MDIVVIIKSFFCLVCVFLLAGCTSVNDLEYVFFEHQHEFNTIRKNIDVLYSKHRIERVVFSEEEIKWKYIDSSGTENSEEAETKIVIEAALSKVGAVGVHRVESGVVLIPMTDQGVLGAGLGFIWEDNIHKRPQGVHVINISNEKKWSIYED